VERHSLPTEVQLGSLSQVGEVVKRFAQALACVVSRWVGIEPRRTAHPCEDSILSPLGGRVDRDGAFISRRGPGEGVGHFARGARTVPPCGIRVSSMPGAIPCHRITLVNEGPQTANPAVCSTGGGRATCLTR
jgi:hypothetical protein